MSATKSRTVTSVSWEIVTEFLIRCSRGVGGWGTATVVEVDPRGTVVVVEAGVGVGVGGGGRYWMASCTTASVPARLW